MEVAPCLVKTVAQHGLDPRNCTTDSAELRPLWMCASACCCSRQTSFEKQFMRVCHSKEKRHTLPLLMPKLLGVLKVALWLLANDLMLQNYEQANPRKYFGKYC